MLTPERKSHLKRAMKSSSAESKDERLLGPGISVLSSGVPSAPATPATLSGVHPDCHSRGPPARDRLKLSRPAVRGAQPPAPFAWLASAIDDSLPPSGYAKNLNLYA